MEHHNKISSVPECLSAIKGKLIPKSKLSVQQSIMKGKFVIINYDGKSGAGKSASVQIYSGTEVDPNTGKGKLSKQSYFKHGKRHKLHGTQTIMTYKVRILVDTQFGSPAAFVIRNKHKHRFFLQSASIEAPRNQIIHFDCNSWVYPIKKTKSERLFFSNTIYLPKQTPRTLIDLRKEELLSLRGNETGERKEWDRIYDYDFYNDLGNPDKGQEHIRPVLGGSKSYPYPRRGRTGRPPSNADPLTESWPQAINLDIYVPSDERSSPNKIKELVSKSIKATVHFLVPEAKSILQQSSGSFESFDEIHNMFSSNRNQIKGGWVRENLKKMVPDKLFKEMTLASKNSNVKFPIPRIISENELAWKDDEEFGRQMLAGINPVRIQCLETFPPMSENGVESSIRQSDIEKNIGGMTLPKALDQRYMFILDHHDYLMPFLNRINSKSVCVYASRTLLFLTGDGILKPIAIELSLPGSSGGNEIQRVFLPASQGTEAALWQLAKAHVAANDTVYHQLVSHWLHAHAVVEPFVIATKRQLSVMHPIHRLLSPHFRDTMHINALARSILINSGGILEKTLFSGQVSMELSSTLYKEWRFDEQGLPADLIRRRIALKDPDMDNPTGIQLLLPDYPYATDGLEIWIAIKAWVKDFCSFFYKDEDFIKSDVELQAWWSEIRNVGHGDKRDATWWHPMTTFSNLVEALATSHMDCFCSTCFSERWTIRILWLPSKSSNIM
ncbi:Lipoxygenase [Quillaja saponaria]|uniref:Lipoxygenase n=1 Tax=Quillaja saponaria TaxID=32244 RepID=A0AAD7LP01_QUISA|nr:Lipoxygenase [Quillaja saponaria]